MILSTSSGWTACKLKVKGVIFCVGVSSTLVSGRSYTATFTSHILCDYSQMDEQELNYHILTHDDLTFQM